MAGTDLLIQKNDFSCIDILPSIRFSAEHQQSSTVVFEVTVKFIQI